MKNKLVKTGVILSVLAVAVLAMAGAGAADDTITYSWDGSTLTFSGNSTGTLTQKTVEEALDDESAVSPYNVVISGIGTIGRDAFEFCSGMTSVTLTDSVTTIEDDAFYYCDGLTSFFIPAGVTSIGERVFVDCDGLTSLTVSPDNSAYCAEDGVLFTKDRKTLHTFPAGKSGEYTIPDGVTTISSYAFYGSEKLTGITIPAGVTSIGNSAFNNCTDLTSVSIPEGVTSVGIEAFNTCTGLTSVSIPCSLTTISDAMFNNCESLTSVTIPAGVTTLGRYAFAFCENLNSVTIPETVTTIADNAFLSCTSLPGIVIPAGVTSIGENAFGYCCSMTSLTVSPDNSAYCAEDNVLFTKDRKTLHTFPTGKSGEYTIPDGVTTINNYAFNSNRTLTSVTMPESLTTIGKSAFSGCSGLNSVTIRENVTSIGDYAFYGCASLEEITIPDSVTSIGKSAFHDCSSLKSIQLPEGITAIRNEMFSNCISLEEITIPDSVTSIGTSAFRNCSSLKSIQLPEGITAIRNEMFFNCTSLEEITIPDSVTSIGTYAFDSCSSLKSVKFGKNSRLEETGRYAFNDIGDSVILPVSQKEGYTFNGWVDTDGNPLTDRTITQENASAKYHVDWVEKAVPARSTVTAFNGSKDGSDFIFERAVVITKATLPGATSATVINTSGSGWYTCDLSTDGTNGTVYFQVPLDVISIKGYTVNDVSLLGCKTTYLTSEGGYAKYSAVINGAGSYTIDFEKDAAQKAVETMPVTETKPVETPVTTTPVTTEKTVTTETPTQAAAKSPFPVLGILAGFGIAGLAALRRK